MRQSTLLFISFATFAFHIAQATNGAGIKCDKIISPQAEPNRASKSKGESASSGRALDFGGPRKLIVDTLKANFRKYEHTQTAIDLVLAGVPREEVISFIKPTLIANLEHLENASQGQAFLTRGQPELPKLTGPIAEKSRSISLEDFSRIHNLEEARLTASKMLEYKDSTAILESGPTRQPFGINLFETLRLAFFTGDSNLINRTVQQTLHHNHQKELIAMSVHAKRHDILLQIGEINIARYLFVNRDWISLKYAVDALSEVRGPQKAKARSLLYDLFDIMTSGHILSNEDSVAHRFEKPGQLLKYRAQALNVLYATQEVESRQMRDSVSNFYIMKRTQDKAYINRLEKFLNDESYSPELYERDVDGQISRIVASVAIVENPQKRWEIAEKFLQARFHTPDGLTEAGRLFYSEKRILVALGIALTTGREALVRKVLTMMARDGQLFQNPENSRYTFTQFQSAVQYFPKDLVKKLAQIGPEIFQNNATAWKAQLLNSGLTNFLQNYELEMKEIAWWNARTNGEGPSPSRDLFNNENSIESVKEMVDSALERGARMTEAERIKTLQEAEAEFNNHRFWDASFKYGAVRNLPGLRKTYQTMMRYNETNQALLVSVMISRIEADLRP